MVIRLQKGTLIFGFLLVFLLGTIGFSHAVLNMNEVHYLFEQEKGHSWKDATSKERRNFIRDVQGRGESQEGQLKKKESDESPDILGMTSIVEERKSKEKFEVRSSFEVDTGIEWDDATEKEQEDYVKRYKKEQTRIERKEKVRSKKEEREEKMRTRKFELKKKQLERREKMRKRKEALEHRAKIRKLKSDKKKDEETKRRWEMFRRNLQKAHGQKNVR